MSKLETPMVLKFWESVGGLLLEEFPLVKATSTCGSRYADAVIVLGHEPRRVFNTERASITLVEKEVIVVQAKASRLGMYLLGQALFSAELIRRFSPASIRSVALCTEDDSALRPLVAPFPHLEVVVLPEFRQGTRRQYGSSVP